jgi:dipeptidyl aminopeptidase/acylaminoacyl peptidase
VFGRVPLVHHLYECEGHGFRKAETLVDYYRTVERFLREHVIYNVSKGAL